MATKKDRKEHMKPENDMDTEDMHVGARDLRLVFTI